MDVPQIAALTTSFHSKSTGSPFPLTSASSPPQGTEPSSSTTLLRVPLDQEERTSDLCVPSSFAATTSDRA